MGTVQTRAGCHPRRPPGQRRSTRARSRRSWGATSRRSRHSPRRADSQAPHAAPHTAITSPLRGRLHEPALIAACAERGGRVIVAPSV